MAHPTTRRWATAATVAVALLALGACGSTDSPGSAGPSGNGGFGDAPSASADPSASATPTGGGTGGAGGTGGGSGGGGGGATTPVDRYPKDAKSYMQTFLVAVANGDKVRVAELATENPILIATNANTAYGTLNTQWSSNNCTGTNCQWINTHGDTGSVGVDPDKLGLPNAVSYFSFEGTNLSNDPYGYVDNFLGALGGGNRVRAVFMSSEAIVNQMGTFVDFPRTSQVTDLGGGLTKVEIYKPNRQDEHYLAFKVLSQPGGKANAIKSVCTQYPCNP